MTDEFSYTTGLVREIVLEYTGGDVVESAEPGAATVPGVDINGDAYQYLPIGSTAIPLDDCYEFEEEGGFATLDIDGDPDVPDPLVEYSTYDDELSLLILTAPLAVDLPVDTRVKVWPESFEKRAWVEVMGDEDEDPIDARVPFHMNAILLEGMRTSDTGYESVGLEIDGQDWVIKDIIGEPAKLDGAAIDPDTTIPPAALTDGLPPTATSTLTLGQFAIGALEWSLVRPVPPNADPVRTKIWIDRVENVSFSASASADSTALKSSVSTYPDLSHLPMFDEGIPDPMWIDPEDGSQRPLIQYPIEYHGYAMDYDADGNGPNGPLTSTQTILAISSYSAAASAASGMPGSPYATATITTSSPHGLLGSQLGKPVVIAGAGGFFDGIKQVVALPSSTSLTILYPAAVDVASTPLSGTITFRTGIRLRQADNEYISANYGYFGEIEANQITSGSIEANLILAAFLSIGANVTISPPSVGVLPLTGGIEVRDPAGSVIVRLHPEGCTFRGEVITDILTVLQDLRINGLAHLSSNASFIIDNGISDPAVGPDITQGPLQTVWPAAPAGYSQKGIAWDSTGGQWVRLLQRTTDKRGFMQTVSTAGSPGTVTLLQVGTLLSGHTCGGVSGITIIGSSLYYILNVVANDYFNGGPHLIKCSLSTGADQANYQLESSSPGQNASKRSALGTNGTSVYAAFTTWDGSTTFLYRLTSALGSPVSSYITGLETQNFIFMGVTDFNYGSAKLTLATDSKVGVYALPTFSSDVVGAIDQTLSWETDSSMVNGGLAYKTSGSDQAFYSTHNDNKLSRWSSYYPPSIKTISNKALTSNVATLTSNAHGFSAGQTVRVEGIDSVFNGDYVITATTTNTFSYTKINANVVSAVTSGSAATEQWWMKYADQGAGITQTGMSDTVTSQSIAKRRFAIATVRPAPNGVTGTELYVGYGTTLPASTAFYLRTEIIADRTFILTNNKVTSGATIRTASVNAYSRTGTLVTLTTTAAHNMSSGQTVNVTGVNSAVNGDFLLVTASGSTLTYNTVASGAISGGAGGTATTDPVNTLGGTPGYIASAVGGLEAHGSGIFRAPLFEVEHNSISKTSGQSFASSTTEAVIIFQNDVAGAGANQANNRLITQEGGLYLVNFTWILPDSVGGTGTRQTRILVNGSVVRTFRVASSNAGTQYVSESDLIDLSPGDLITLDFFQNSGGTQSMSNATLKQTKLGVIK